MTKKELEIRIKNARDEVNEVEEVFIMISKTLRAEKDERTEALAERIVENLKETKESFELAFKMVEELPLDKAEKGVERIELSVEEGKKDAEIAIGLYDMMQKIVGR